MNVLDFIPQHTQEEINPQAPEDYIGEDGLLYCGVCNQKKQFRIVIKDYDRVVLCICDCRKKEIEEENRRRQNEEDMRVIRDMKAVSLMPGKFKQATFDSYTIRRENKRPYTIATNYVQNFQQMKRENQGLLLYGPVGTGKSYTAACIANALLDKKIPVIMTSFVKILQDVRSEEDEQKFARRMNTASLVIIDDLGAERGTDFALEKVYNIVDSRVRSNMPMILTTNLLTVQMQETEDIRYKRIYDRIFEVCYPIEMKGTSFRKLQAAARQASMKELLEE